MRMAKTWCDALAIEYDPRDHLVSERKFFFETRNGESQVEVDFFIRPSARDVTVTIEPAVRVIY